MVQGSVIRGQRAREGGQPRSQGRFVKADSAKGDFLGDFETAAHGSC
jgi:hypothetical protein